MQVPLNWADVTSKKISITVLRIRSASQKDRIGSLVINPGGPGGSGIQYSLDAALDELPDAILDRFDIVGFDPRGIGLSSPIQCINDKEKDAELNLPADPISNAQWQAEIADATKVAQDCYTAYGSDLTYYSTAETARDMEALRAKLGDPKLTYLGYSYGTLIGAEYASAYPDKVRALVLDGAVDPTISSVDQDKTQSAGFQLAFSHFAASCTAKGSSCKLGSDPQQYVLNLMAKAAAHPIASGDAKDKRTADDGAVLLGVISALYDESEWPDLTTALVDANKGDASGILSLDDEYNERDADGTYTNLEDANATIGCADTTDRLTVAQARELQPQWRASNPIFGGVRGIQPWVLQFVESPARPTHHRREQGRRTDLGHRHNRRPGDTDLGRSTPRRTARVGPAAGLAGRRAYRLPQDDVHHQRREPLPDQPNAAGDRSDLPSGLVLARQQRRHVRLAVAVPAGDFVRGCIHDDLDGVALL